MSLRRIYEEDSWSMVENGTPLLTVQETEEDSKIVLTLSGTLRSDMEHVFKDELAALMTVGQNVVVDCAALRYISNTCQDALLSTQQMADGLQRGALTLRNVPAEIYAEFQKTNLHELLMIE